MVQTEIIWQFLVNNNPAIMTSLKVSSLKSAALQATLITTV